tara:strand:+ start:4154 stop:4576 length:423 start_codon:yes stop_codon:yes gene_type:complete
VISETIISSESDWIKWSSFHEKTLSGVVAIHGVMGAGKTSAIKNWLISFNSQDVGSSPTFSLMNEYKSPNGPIFHFDFYRITEAAEAEDIGLTDYLYSGNPCWIEWPENISELLPEDAHHLYITENSLGSRKITLETYDI